MSRHSRSKFFPKVVETLVVAWEGDVLSDGLRVQALSKVELSIGDQGEVGAKFITGNSVKLAYHRSKWGCSSHRLLPNTKLLNCLLRQEVLVDVSAGGLHRELVQAHNLIFSNVEDKVENHNNLLLITTQVWSVLAGRDCMVDHQVF